MRVRVVRSSVSHSQAARPRGLCRGLCLLYQKVKKKKKGGQRMQRPSSRSARGHTPCLCAPGCGGFRASPVGAVSSSRPPPRARRAGVGAAEREMRGERSGRHHHPRPGAPLCPCVLLAHPNAPPTRTNVFIDERGNSLDLHTSRFLCITHHHNTPHQTTTPAGRTPSLSQRTHRHSPTPVFVCFDHAHTTTTPPRRVPRPSHHTHTHTPHSAGVHI